ncbi:MAG TPA: helix-turn-helix transcriptional regulator [Pyrinomonadaceae bacterium]|nr:helix-turn-helix transcriptional regulator [Pyrinomonadaceae bacterium]
MTKLNKLADVAVATLQEREVDETKSATRTYIGEFEELVLLAILSQGENAYGVTIREALEEATNRSITIGSLYTTLSRLEEKGLVQSWVGEPTAERGGRAKRHYRVKGSAQSLLQEVQAARQRLMNAVPIGGLA